MELMPNGQGELVIVTKPPSIFNKNNIRKFSIPGFILLALLVIILLNFFEIISSPLLSFLPTKSSLYHSQVVAKVDGQPITRSQVISVQKILEGPLKAQKTRIASVSAEVSFDTALEETKKRVKIQLEGQKRSINVSDKEIEDFKKSLPISDMFTSQIALYGWTEKDWQDNARYTLLQEKVKKAVISFRNVQIVSLRWDFIEPSKRPPLQNLQTDAKNLLKPILGTFDQGRSLDETFSLVNTDEVKKVFVPQKSSATPSNLASEIKKQALLITSPSKDDDLGNFIIKKQLPSKADIFCNQTACYAIKFIDGNNGQYATLDDFFQGKVFK